MTNRDNTDWADKAQELIQNQFINWSLLKTNYENLAKVEYHTFSFNGFEIQVQHNPARITSTSADVSTSAIQNRKCFLCKENRPIEQKDLVYNNDFIILANPFPILPEHFTIASRLHIEQSIENHTKILLDLSKDLGDKYSVYYNGPKCGASAPDHMHYQAGTKNVLPIEKDYESIKKNFASMIYKKENTSVYSLENIFRNGIIIESGKKHEAMDLIKRVISELRNFSESSGEPMLNIICTYENDRWRIIFFPRKAHRPKEYFASSFEKILVSPAVIDLGGLIIAPRKEDFEKLKEEHIINIFNQVTLADSTHKKLVARLTSILS